MRSGVGVVNETDSHAAAHASFIGTAMGLLRVFSEEAVLSAGEYAVAHGRSNVSHDDMQKALKYQARMFFQQVGDDFDGRVHAAARDLLSRTEVDDEDGEAYEEEEDDDDGNDDGNDANSASVEEEDYEAEDVVEDEAAAEEDDDANSVSTSNSKSTVSTISASSLASSVVAATLAPATSRVMHGDAEQCHNEAEVARCKATARRVDAIVASWHRYEPDDPILCMIKNAIDATDRRPAPAEERDVAPTKRQRSS